MPMTGGSWGRVVHTNDWERIKSWPVCETVLLLGAGPSGELMARTVAHGDPESGVSVAGRNYELAGRRDDQNALLKSYCLVQTDSHCLLEETVA
jgi:hypothetical protein